jgi:hypothetical protein
LVPVITEKNVIIYLYVQSSSDELQSGLSYSTVFVYSVGAGKFGPPDVSRNNSSYIIFRGKACNQHGWKASRLRKGVGRA